MIIQEEGTIRECKSQSFIDRYVQWFEYWMPSSTVIVLLLTLLIALSAFVFCDSPIFVSIGNKKSIVDSWADGFWGLLEFSMQMCLIMITGSVFSNAPIIKSGLVRLAKMPNTQNQALLMNLIVGCILGWIHWGIGMMGGIVIGRETLAQAKLKGCKIHKPAFIGITVCRMAYAGAGLSQASALFAATPGKLASLVPKEFSALVSTIPLSETTLRPVVFFQIIALSILTWFFIQFMLPKKEGDIEEISDEFCQEILNSGKFSSVQSSEKLTFAEKLNQTYIFNIIIGGAALIWVGQILFSKGIVGLSINNFNFLMLGLGLLFTGTPAQFTKCVTDFVNSVWGVIIQFPFYAGIFGLITYTGLAHHITELFLNISTPTTYPAITFVYSTVLDIFIPSGGSKFVIEAPYVIPVAIKLGVPISTTINAYIFGDLTGHIIQPFWLLPIISMYKTRFSQIMPYSFIFALIAIGFNILVFLFLY